MAKKTVKDLCVEVQILTEKLISFESAQTKKIERLEKDNEEKIMKLEDRIMHLEQKRNTSFDQRESNYPNFKCKYCTETFTKKENLKHTYLHFTPKGILASCVKNVLRQA